MTTYLINLNRISLRTDSKDSYDSAFQNKENGKVFKIYKFTGGDKILWQIQNIIQPNINSQVYDYPLLTFHFETILGLQNMLYKYKY